MKFSKKVKKFAKKNKWLGLVGLVAGSVVTELINEKMMQSAVEDCVDEKLHKLAIEQKNAVVEEEDE